MRRFLRAYLNWLDRRFPERLVVTQESFARLKGDLIQHEALVKAHEEKIKKLEEQMANINVAVGFSVPKAGTLQR